MLVIEDGIVAFIEGSDYLSMFPSEDIQDGFAYAKRMIVHRDFVVITKRSDYSTLYVPVRFIKYMEES